MSTIKLGDCTPTFRVTPSYESPGVIEHIVMSLNHPVAGNIGELEAVMIIRFRAGDTLFEVLDAESDELMRLGTVVLDKFGLVRPWLIDNEFHKGTGCWGTEMNANKGPMVYITEMNVIPEHRDKGVGSEMLKQLINSEHLMEHGFVVCWPAPDLNRHLPVSEAQFQTEQDRVNHFFRLNGFRRIGRTQFFAYSPDPSHPSHSLSIESDLDPEPNPWGGQPPAAFDPFNPPAPEVLPALHAAIANNKTPFITQRIQAAFAADPMSLSEQDRHGLRPVYIAAAAENLPAVRALLSLGVQEDLSKRDNADLMTPLERCAKTMRSSRDLAESILGDWDGYSDESLLVKAALKRAMGHEMPSTDEEYLRQKKYGCSCGRCVGGWLSPKMQFRLKADADFVYDTASMNLMSVYPAFRSREVLSPMEATTEMSLDYIPRYLFPHLYKTFYKGNLAVFKGISLVLGRSGLQSANHSNLLATCIPTPAAVLATLENDGWFDYFDTQAVRFYLQRGGRVEYALDAITHRSKEMSSLGDGDFDAMWDGSGIHAAENSEDEASETSQLWRSLPHCNNDLEFGMVRRQLGLNPRASWGPYDMEDEGGMSVDDEELEELFIG
ncbi:hypothetical protein HYDPIDRAFT_39613 [Hydnomerulius pinastri MD-312]|nr:hypothetical protein HYDPIDRAFT_39613 [Hydnomerulius pinastri MD-312]